VVPGCGFDRRETRRCRERTYDTTVADVWDAVTNGERIPRWFLPIEGDLRLGGHHQLQGNASGEVIACDPPTHLAVTWEFGGAVSWADVHLADDPDGGARLRLEHVALVEGIDIWDQFGPGAVGIGWGLALFGLAEHLRTGGCGRRRRGGRGRSGRRVHGPQQRGLVRGGRGLGDARGRGPRRRRPHAGRVHRRRR
jgi:uncharacterized protein YndB with AHSA1/START domain